MPLTIREEQFIENRLLHGMSYGECWRVYKPDSIQSDELARRSGWRTMKRLTDRLGEWPEVYESAGIGPDVIAYVLSESLKATKPIFANGKRIDVPDHMARIRAAHELKDIFGLNAPQKLNIEQKGPPLPLVVILNDEPSEPQEIDTEYDITNEL